MFAAGLRPALAASVATTDAILRTLAAVTTSRELEALMEDITSEFGFRYYALIHHADLGKPLENCVDTKRYPEGAVHRIVGKATWRHDPVIRACAAAGHAFLWSDLDQFIELGRRDRESMEMGAREGLNEGITIPYSVLGQRSGSCTFAGTRLPNHAPRYLGMAQFAGVFAFQTARRLLSSVVDPPLPLPRLHPRPRDCVVLAGRGLSNKEIARELGLTPRTVDGYLTEARRRFRSTGRTELVIAALASGEIELAEIRTRQPE